MKRFICYIQHQGFAICDGDGNFIRTTLDIMEASDNVDKYVWHRWCHKHKPLICYILEKD